VLDAVRELLAADPRIAYAIAFGSVARDRAGPHSDLDVAIGLVPGAALDLLALGALTGRLTEASGRPVDVVLLDEAPPALAYRVFRDGQALVVRDAAALASRKARAILEYLDFQPFEQILTRGALAAAGRGR
jgi:predicted nucleotidyltransferase